MPTEQSTSESVDATRLRQLSDEVSRIASSLARISDKAQASVIIQHRPSQSKPVSVELVRATIAARRHRAKFFRADLFADPAWDILLILLHAELTGIRMQVSSVCEQSAVPPTTAIRWIKIMADEGLVTRRPDPFDGRRVFLELSPSASEAMRAFFDQVQEPLA